MVSPLDSPIRFALVELNGIHHNALDDAIYQAQLSALCTKVAMDVRELVTQKAKEGKE